jgi:hypothetical protein
MSDTEIRETVRERYAEIARSVQGPGSCCYDGEVGSRCISANLYADDETGALPKDAVLASLAAAIPQRSPSYGTARQFLILAPAAASTFCSRRAVSAPRARPTGST